MSQFPGYSPQPIPADQSSVVPKRGPRRTVSALLLVAVIALVIALAGAGTVAVVQTTRLADQRDEVARLQAQAQADAEAIAGLQSDLAELEEAPAALPPAAPANPLEDLLGPGGLEGLLGEGGLDALLGDGGLESLLGDLGSVPDVGPCLADVEDLPDVGGQTLQQQFDETVAAVQQLRGLTLPQPIQPELLTGDEVREFITADIEENYTAETADVERRMLGLLQAAPADIDLIATQTDLLGDQVAGFYNPDTGQLVVRADDPTAPLTATGLTVLAHELEHALVDAVVGLPELDGFGSDDDGAVAALAVVEGSAVALQSQFQHAALNPLSLLADLGSILGADTGLDGVPEVIVQSLTFPYLTGASYVCGLYAAGGWEAIDEAIANPPATTHQVMFPEAGVTEAVAVDQPAGPAGFDLADRRSFGAAHLSWLFGAPGDDTGAALEDPVAAVEPWRGGEVSLWTDGPQSAVALVLAGADLCQPVTQWWTAAAGGGEQGAVAGAEQVVQATAEGTWGVVTCDGEDVRVGIGASADTARQASAG
ncbi:hypothetical protein BH23ACT9_BH23ACT9_15100 [soil metagenome]